MFLLLLLFCVGLCDTESYKQMSYGRIRDYLQLLAIKYPQVMVLSDSKQMFGIEHKVQCDSGPCIMDIVNITDQGTPALGKVQVYISGALHGDERIGPNIAVYLIETLVTNFNKDPWVTKLLKQREIIITPMTNAPGYFRNQREEPLLSGLSADINRDFPYNNDPSKCMNTIAARVIYKLFVNNLFVTSITFHGGTNSITYPWGSLNHILKNGDGAEAPDHVALDSLAQSMNLASGPTFSQDGKSFIYQYDVGGMTKTVYPVGGSFEDWAYAAGWDQSERGNLKICIPTSYELDPSFFTPANNISTAIYLIETDDDKNPNDQKYGSREIKIFNDNGTLQVELDSILNIGSKYDGHINRNIRASLVLIDMAKPYIDVFQYQSTSNYQVEVTFRVQGCTQINNLVATVQGQKVHVFSDLDQSQIGYCNHAIQPQTTYKLIVNPSDTIVINALVDQQFKQSLNSTNVRPENLKGKPQTHFAKLRLDNKYQVENKHHSVNGGITFTITPNMMSQSTIQLESVFVLAHGKRLNYTNQWQFYEFGDFTSYYLRNSLISLGQIITEKIQNPVGNAVVTSQGIFIAQTDQFYGLPHDSRATCTNRDVFLILDFSKDKLMILYNQTMNLTISQGKSVLFQGRLQNCGRQDAVNLPQSPNVVVQYQTSNNSGEINCVFGNTNHQWRLLMLCPLKNLDQNFVEYADPQNFTADTLIWVILASCVAGGLIGFGVFKIIQRFFYKEILAEDFDQIGPTEMIQTQ